MTPPQAPIGRLVVCPTPIGNLEDVTLRVLHTLASADLVACEDTRHTKRLLDRHGIHARLVSFHEHNEAGRARELGAEIAGGSVIALVSDAGTPLISDPGYQLLQECLAAGLPVEVLPGPSAVMVALLASGLPCERFTFAGFLPRSRGEIAALLGTAAETLIAFESPRRLAGTLEILAQLDPDRPAAVCRELTKIHEETRRGSAGELAEHYRQNPPRGEIVLVCGAAPAGRADREQALAALRGLIAAGARPRAAATAVAGLTGIGANELYRALTGPAARQ
jgi:16S rRNA (cytidine1402-2'-O)-methyltransferase